MKKKLLGFFLLLAAGASAQTINIPDVTFKSKLLSATTTNNIAVDSNGNKIKIDTNLNGEIEESEALLVYELNLMSFGNKCESLEGIQYFLNLRKLVCSAQNFSALDVSMLTHLTYLDCRASYLESLNVSGLTNLEYLDFEYNEITSFDSTGLTNLETLACGSNLLTSLIVSGSTTLNLLKCDHNQLTSLDVSMHPQLSSLVCGDNTISTLVLDDLQPLKQLEYPNNPLPNVNISAYTQLENLDCTNVGVTSLDLTGFTALSRLFCSDNLFTSLGTDDLTDLTYLQCTNSLLTHLDLSHSLNLHYITVNDNPLLTSINLHNGGTMMYVMECNFTNNPNLQFICVDEGEAEELIEHFENYLIPAPAMSTDCSFIGGLHNSISGVLKYDFDGSGCDTDDYPVVYTKVKVTSGTDEKIRFTNKHGGYFMSVGSGDYNITVEPLNSLFLFTPSSASVNFPAWDGTAHVQDFCFTSNGVNPDVEIVIAPVMRIMPGFNTGYKLILKNNGNQLLSGTVTFNFDDTVLDFLYAYPQPISVTGGVITWNYTDLLPFENRSLNVTLDSNAPTDTPPVNIGDQLDFTAQVIPISGDLTPDNNSFELNEIVVGSFDPNNIICLQGETESPEVIGDYLGYVINFENTGNAAATFVVVTQQIDETMFDVKSLELLNSSHDVEATIDGNMVEFRFDAINLAGGAQGNIVFKIKTLQTLEEGDEVMNSAEIVFDHNFPIQTNTATTLFETVLDRENFETNNFVTVYPNPTKDNVTINADSNLQAIQLYDIQGRLLQTTFENNNTTTFDIAKRAAGIYFLKVTTDKGTKVEKLIKE